MRMGTTAAPGTMMREGEKVLCRQLLPVRKAQ
jgi:hypothetical protein